MLNNLVLDIGNVICEWNPTRLAASAIEGADAQTQLLSDTVSHEDWLELDRGTLTTQEAISRAQSRSSLDPNSVAKLYENLPASLTPIAPSVEAIQELGQAGVNIYILSNMHLKSWEYLQENIDVWQWCKGVVVSCDAGHIKPEPAIYNHLCEKFSVAPASCVFVDDMAENVEAAIACGWQAEQLTDISKGGQLFRQLAEKFGT